LARGAYIALTLFRARYFARKGTLVSISHPGFDSPLFLRARTTDARVFIQIFIEEELFAEVDRFASFVVDAGAYSGLSSAYLSRTFPNARILAMELEASNFALLQINTVGIPSVIPVHKALWWRTANVNINDLSCDAWSYSASECNPGCAGGIEAVTIDDVLRDYDAEEIDFLKLDIEGAERELFARDSRFLDRVGTLAVELHDRKKPGCNKALELAIDGKGFVRRQQGEYVVLSRALTNCT
jgi:FkbM family methyltransferase